MQGFPKAKVAGSIPAEDAMGTDIEWLVGLHEELYRDEGQNRIQVVSSRRLTNQEFARVLAAIEKHKLVAEMVCTSMFGAYGMRLYEHELYPGTGARELVLINEEQLPVPTRYEHMEGTAKPIPERRSGCGRDDAWEVFSKYTHAEQNRVWLKQYKLQESKYRSYYDY